MKKVAVITVVSMAMILGLKGVNESSTPEVVASANTEVSVTSTSESVNTETVVEAKVKEEPTAEKFLYFTWEESTDSSFEYENWTENVNENLMACAEEYTIDSMEYDENDNVVVYWHTDYMKARIVVFADRDYKYIEANYFVEEDNDYTGDTLYFRR